MSLFCALKVSYLFIVLAIAGRMGSEYPEDKVRRQMVERTGGTRTDDYQTRERDPSTKTKAMGREDESSLNNIQNDIHNSFYHLFHMNI